MRYRIENIWIPETGGLADPGDPNDKNQDLKGRRIVHVLGVEPKPGMPGVKARVLTEEADHIAVSS
jgi:hypothetical protein